MLDKFAKRLVKKKKKGREQLAALLGPGRDLVSQRPTGPAALFIVPQKGKEELPSLVRHLKQGGEKKKDGLQVPAWSSASVRVSRKRGKGGEVKKLSSVRGKRRGGGVAFYGPQLAALGKGKGGR